MSVVPALRDGVEVLLQELIGSTPSTSGNETIAADLLRDYLAESGVEAGPHRARAGRANLVARLPGRDADPSLALLSHTDVVLADASEWQLDPFSGEIRDDEIWGRGRARHEGTGRRERRRPRLARARGFRPNGDLVFIAAADEEVGVESGCSG